MTAGVAATAYAGIPVTHRDDASAVAFVTGHEDPEKAETALDWEALAALPRHPRLLHGRQTAGRERGGADRGRARPRGARGGDRARHDGRASAPSPRRSRRSPPRSSARAIGAPALIVVGAVVARRESLAWLERRPLHGRRVVVTRARAQASGLAATLRGLGAEVVELPAIRIEPRIESDGGARARSPRSATTRWSA